MANEIVLPIIDNMKDKQYPTPEEYTYWKSRENRTFFIDYEVDECYNLIELSKVIIQMNMEERDIENPKPIYIYSFIPMAAILNRRIIFATLYRAVIFLLLPLVWV